MNKKEKESNKWKTKHRFVTEHPIATWLLSLIGLWYSGVSILGLTYFGILPAWITIPLFAIVFFTSARGFWLGLDSFSDIHCIDEEEMTPFKDKQRKRDYQKEYMRKRRQKKTESTMREVKQE